MNTTSTYWHRNDYLVVLVLIITMYVWCKIKAWHNIVVLDNRSSLNEQHLYISHQHSQKSHILAQSNFRIQILQETMTFLGEMSSQTIVNSILAFIFLNRSITHNKSSVYFQSFTLIPIWVPNDCSFEMLKSKIHNTLQLTDDKYLDEIYYR